MNNFNHTSIALAWLAKRTDEVINDFEVFKKAEKDAIPEEEKQLRKEAFHKVKEGYKKAEADTYVSLTFSTQKAKRLFMQNIGEEPESLYIKGEIFAKKHLSYDL